MNKVAHTNVFEIPLCIVSDEKYANSVLHANCEVQTYGFNLIKDQTIRLIRFVNLRSENISAHRSPAYQEQAKEGLG